MARYHLDEGCQRGGWGALCGVLLKAKESLANAWDVVKDASTDPDKGNFPIRTPVLESPPAGRDLAQ